MSNTKECLGCGNKPHYKSGVRVVFKYGYCKSNDECSKLRNKESQRVLRQNKEYKEYQRKYQEDRLKDPIFRKEFNKTKSLRAKLRYWLDSNYRNKRNKEAIEGRKPHGYWLIIGLRDGTLQDRVCRNRSCRCGSFKCFYCKEWYPIKHTEAKRMMTVDHIKPRKTHPELIKDIDNLRLACKSCNSSKYNLPA